MAKLRRKKMPYHKVSVRQARDILAEALEAQQSGDLLRLTVLLHEAGSIFAEACMTRVPKKAQVAFGKEMYGLFVNAWELGGEQFERDFGTPQGFKQCVSAE